MNADRERGLEWTEWKDPFQKRSESKRNGNIPGCYNNNGQGDLRLSLTYAGLSFYDPQCVFVTQWNRYDRAIKLILMVFPIPPSFPSASLEETFAGLFHHLSSMAFYLSRFRIAALTTALNSTRHRLLLVHAPRAHHLSSFDGGLLTSTVIKRRFLKTTPFPRIPRFPYLSGE